MVLLLLDQRLEVSAEFLDAGHDRRRARITQHADRLARHVFGDLQQRVQIFRSTVAGHDALEYLRGPRRALAALRALRTALVREETRRASDLLHEILGVVDENHAARS